MPLPENDRRSDNAPVTLPSSADTTPEDTEAEMAAQCAAYEELRRLSDGGESVHGTDYADGPLAPAGCPW